jgi:hypothetical protein
MFIGMATQNFRQGQTISKKQLITQTYARTEGVLALPGTVTLSLIWMPMRVV